MERITWNKGWEVRHLGTEEDWKAVTLPYDAMLREPRSDKARGMHNIGWFESCDYEYRKRFRVGQEEKDQKLILVFEGIYHNAEIYLNGVLVEKRPYGYTQILVDLDGHLTYDGENEVRVIAHNADQPNSRWYSGSGIYRPVWLCRADRSGYLLPFGTKIHTISLHPARVEIAVQANRAGQVEYEIVGPDGKTAAGGIISITQESERSEPELRSESTDCQTETGQKITVGLSGSEQNPSVENEGRNFCGSVTAEVPDAAFWSVEHPALYTLRAGFGKDRAEILFGIRMVSWDAQHGFCINGERVILKGACIHSDNQLLGAEVYPEAEERRVRLLKDAGYNAIRSAHNPASRDLLDACDRLGMLVMDEYTDMWYIHKNRYDYAAYMPTWWQRDLKDMVDKDYNHPCVVLYSTGNEVAETGQKRGIALAGEMTGWLHQLDGTRPVTCGINIFFNLLYRLGFGVYSDDKSARDAAKAESGKGSHKAVGSEFYNQLAGILGDKFMKLGATTHACDVLTRGAFANMDAAGYNYGIWRYRHDLRKYPERLIVGSETFCKDAYDFYEMAERNPRLIGDFVWAGMDYLGEAGIGSWEYEDYAPKKADPAGWIAAGSGRLDLTGRGGGEMRYTQVAFQKEKGPFLSVVPVYQRGKHSPSAWKMTNGIESWSWHGCDGFRADVTVFAQGAEAELLLNGRSLGRKRLKKCEASFHVSYEDGTLEAVTYDASGQKLGSTLLRTAGEETQLQLIPEKEKAAVGKLLYIRLRFTDAEGIWKPMDHHTVRVSVKNGTLVALGSACPYNPDGFLQDTVRTYYGEALAIVRAGENGNVEVSAMEDGIRAGVEVPIG